MEKIDQSLQKFTEYESKEKYLLERDTITNFDLQILSPEEVKRFESFLGTQINQLEDVALDGLLCKIEAITPLSVKNQIWESNHVKISNSIARLIDERGRMPSKQDISTDTKLSRQTIHKHLKEYTKSPLYTEQLEMFKLMSLKVLAKVFEFAIGGDVAACKLYLNTVAEQPSKAQEKTSQVIRVGYKDNTLIQRQNNFFQINNTILNQENLSRLNQSQIIEIENILKAALPESR